MKTRVSTCVGANVTITGVDIQGSLLISKCYIILICDMV